MASNVFGSPITDYTLKGMPEYKDKAVITATDRAHVAFQKKNAANKDSNASKYVQGLKDKWGNGTSVLCVIYNATGNPLTFVTSHDYAGELGSGPYPITLENGQWGGFLHVSKVFSFTSESNAAVVYRGKNANGDGRDWMLAWDDTFGEKKGAYTEIREVDHYKESNDRWGTVNDKLYRSGLTYTDEWGGCVSDVSIGDSTSPFFEGIMTLVNAKSD